MCIDVVDPSSIGSSLEIHERGVRESQNRLGMGRVKKVKGEDINKREEISCITVVYLLLTTAFKVYIGTIV